MRIHPARIEVVDLFQMCVCYSLFGESGSVSRLRRLGKRILKKV